MKIAFLGAFAFLLGIVGTPFLQLQGARPDTLVAFVAAAGLCDLPLRNLLGACIFLGFGRVFLGSESAASEAVALIAQAAFAGLFLRRVFPRNSLGVLGILCGCAFAYAILLLATFLWCKGLSQPFSYPLGGGIMISLLLTFILSLAFSEVLKWGEKDGLKA